MDSEIVSCQLCNLLSPDLRTNISHIRQVHSKDSNFSLVCGIQECSQQFNTYSAFNSHVYRAHRDSLGLDTSVSCSEDPQHLSQLPTCSAPLDFHSYTFKNHDLPEDIQFDIWHLLGVDRQKEQREAAKFLLKLKEICKVSERTVSEVVSGYRYLIAHSLRVVKANAKDSLGHAGVSMSDIDAYGLEEAFDDVPDIFEGLQTSYLQEKYFRDHFHLQEPIEIPLDSAYVNCFSGIKRRKVLSTRTFLYVSLFDTLSQLLQNKDILNEVTRVRHSDHMMMKDYCDGSCYSNHPLFSSDSQALQIVGYFDELEVTNPVGSYVKTHRLGCLFFTLANIQPQYRSSLKAIFLLAVARCEDIDKYGIDKFLAPFVDDLKRLYLDGITVTTELTEVKYYGALVAFLADTQAAHKVGGFKGSAAFAHRICRSCMATRDDIQSLFSEQHFKLRTPEEHVQQCHSLVGTNRHSKSVEYGINRTSILEEVPGFSVTTCLPHDIMHDLFEGVVHYELKLFLLHCTSNNFFSIETLNSRLRSYDFGVEDKPSLIDKSSLDQPNKKFSQSAAQMITLVRNLPMLIADKIPEDNTNWYSVLVLIKICQIALSPVLSFDTVPYLKILVEEKLQLYSRLYPSSTLKLKMHHMVHYPSQIERFGPLIHSWTMRHEAKLSFIKRSSRRGNFKNIVKTVVKHHQLWFCYQLNCEDHLLYPEPQLSPKERVSCLSQETDNIRSQLLAADPSITSACNLKNHSWLKIQSSTYKLGMFVLLERHDMSPKFGKIINIIQIQESKQLFFCVEVFEGFCFCTHYNAFGVRNTTNVSVIQVHSLQDHHSYLVRKSFNLSDDTLYIAMAYIY